LRIALLRERLYNKARAIYRGKDLEKSRISSCCRHAILFWKQLCFIIFRNMKLECIAVLLHTFISVITINVILTEKRQILQIAFYLLFPRSSIS